MPDSGYYFAAQEQQGQQSREGVIRALPWLTPLVDRWADHLEFWDQSGGFDNVTQDEIDGARASIVDEAEEIIAEHAPKDLRIAESYVNLCLHTAIGIRKEIAHASVEDISGGQDNN